MKESQANGPTSLGTDLHALVDRQLRHPHRDRTLRGQRAALSSKAAENGIPAWDGGGGLT